MSKIFDIDSGDFIAWTRKLEKIHRSALPIAVRQTLNYLAFETKQKQVDKVFNKRFTVRKKNFIKSHTGVNKCANTFDIDQMVSEVGIIKGKSRSGDELEKQEFGGVSEREKIPLDAARTAKNPKKLVSKKHYLANIKAKKNIDKFKNQQFIRAVFKAGKGGHVIYDNIIYSVKSVKRAPFFTKLEAIYSIKKGRKITIKKAKFMEPAGKIEARQVVKIFERNAIKQMNKYK